LRKFSSILPANARLTTVDLTASPSRRPGAYNPYTGEVTKSSVKQAEPIKLKPIEPVPVEPIKLDKVSLSQEAEALKNDPKTEAITKTHNKLKGYG